MLHEECNELIVKSTSDNDGFTLSPQQYNSIKIPTPLLITHEDCNETTENLTKKIPDLCTCVVDYYFTKS